MAEKITKVHAERAFMRMRSLLPSAKHWIIDETSKDTWRIVDRRVDKDGNLHDVFPFGSKLFKTGEFYEFCHCMIDNYHYMVANPDFKQTVREQRHILFDEAEQDETSNYLLIPR
jgi:hypothetical protein